jgi:hypothetical protein
MLFTILGIDIAAIAPTIAKAISNSANVNAKFFDFLGVQSSDSLQIL